MQVLFRIMLQSKSRESRATQSSRTLHNIDPKARDLSPDQPPIFSSAITGGKARRMRNTETSMTIFGSQIVARCTWDLIRNKLDVNPVETRFGSTDTRSSLPVRSAAHFTAAPQTLHGSLSSLHDASYSNPVRNRKSRNMHGSIGKAMLQSLEDSFAFRSTNPAVDRGISR